MYAEFHNRFDQMSDINFERGNAYHKRSSNRTAQHSGFFGPDASDEF